MENDTSIVVEYPQQAGEGGSMGGRVFSLRLYLVIVFALSWPFQIIAAIWGLDLLARYTLHAVSMCMVGVGTFIAGRYVFKDGFAGAGWGWGKPRHYIAVVGLICVLWIVPMLLDMALGKMERPHWTSAELIWVGVFMLNFLPAFGEEIGWRGYMLPRLAQRYTPWKAVLIHGIIWWLWHLPVLAGVGAWVGIMAAEEMQMSVVAAAVVSSVTVVIVSGIGAILHSFIFAYFWAWSGSLAVATFYHLLYDGVRDSIQSFIGSGTVSSIWAMVMIVLFGAILFWKVKWKRLDRFHARIKGVRYIY